jgi:hypothetical protein
MRTALSNHRYHQAFSVARRSLFSSMKNMLVIQPDVQEALDSKKPVVALESTIVAHGMPFPENLELARAVEDILRSKVSSLWNPLSRCLVLIFLPGNQLYCDFRFHMLYNGRMDFLRASFLPPLPSGMASAVLGCPQKNLKILPRQGRKDEQKSVLLETSHCC